MASCRRVPGRRSGSNRRSRGPGQCCIQRPRTPPGSRACLPLGSLFFVVLGEPGEASKPICERPVSAVRQSEGPFGSAGHLARRQTPTGAFREGPHPVGVSCCSVRERLTANRAMLELESRPGLTAFRMRRHQIPLHPRVAIVLRVLVSHQLQFQDGPQVT
jgi:hypothetical protein